jgi:hypothetical protein
MRTRIGFVIVAALLALLVDTPSFAAHHLWTLNQAFSNADGSVQFVTLFTTDGSETGLQSQSVTGSTTFTFPSNLSGSTANKWLLLATSNFQGLTGVQPDGIIPAHFLSTGGGTVTYTGPDSWTYGALPIDGRHMLVRGNAMPVAAVATNFAGASASVSLSSAVPAVPRWSLVLGVGLLLLAGSGLLRRQHAAAAA